MASVNDGSAAEPQARGEGGFFALLFRRMLERRIDRDGAVPALEDAARPKTRDPQVDLERQELNVLTPAEVVDRALSQKVLHGWVHNRLQTRMAQTFRLNGLAPEERELTMRFAAVAMLVTGLADEAARHAVEDRLRAKGADVRLIEMFRAAAAAPEPLSALISAVRSRSGNRELLALAYAATVLAIDLREAAGKAFAQLIAARLALPADAVREADSIFGGSARQSHVR